ncbi:PaaR repeat-containing protein [Billgrantia antri]|uniref:PaaR repeat-containing protein n=1 Tax=Halomonas sulfidivorans TaxID=2733488 RepID=A0ABX7WN07_9GAMM|nr:PAAR domain-containing protein [Halomonas sulfidivorans]QTP60927.1 PaaR repeat-containing protein [Halomonas sulfidivorans]
MPAVTRLGDSCTGHGSYPPRASTGGSGDVFANGIAVHRQGDAWATHCNSTPTCHGGSLASGSSTVYANGQQLGRIGDPVDCGSSVAAGSADVFAG